MLLGIFRFFGVFDTRYEIQDSYVTAFLSPINILTAFYKSATYYWYPKMRNKQH